MKTGHVSCLGSRGFHRMHYVEWGEPAAECVVICAHGLTRNGRDFDALAQALPEFRVVCPDFAGRGSSDWLAAKEDYGYRQYCADATALIARITAPGRASPARLFWVGTSMGGIVGMLLAAAADTPIEKLVLNDVGGFIPAAALERIARYVGTDVRFANFGALEASLRTVCAPFGPLTDAQWHHLAVHSAAQHADGRWGMRYDPAIGDVFRASPIADVDLWPHYDAVRCPTLVLRGERSDLLTAETAALMTGRGPRARLAAFAGVGHAPALMAPDQIAVVREFLIE